MSGSRITHRRVIPFAVTTLVATLLAGLVPTAPVLAAGPERDGDPGAQPSIAYLEAMAHEDDRIEFEPGGLVEVPFTPRAGDRWPIDGDAPVPLPPGRATGRQMAASPNGSEWAELAPRGGPGKDAGATAAPDPTPSAGSAVPTDPPDAPPSADPGGSLDPAASPAPSPAPIDEPAGDPALPADGAAFLDPSEPAFDLAAASGLRRQVFGFLPYWELSGAATTLNYDVLSTIAYFSVGANGTGDLRKQDPDGTGTTGWGGWTSSNMTRVINEAHERGTRVVLTISVFAWTANQADTQRALLGSATARQNLARQAAAAVRDRGADGINLDFEPLASGYADEFVALLRTMRSELNRVRSGYQLTYDTTGYIGNYPLEASVGTGAADAIFIMGYDYRTAGSNTAGSIDPLSGPKYDLTDTVRAYAARVSPSRLILGLPWYGRAWSTTSSDVRAESQSGAKYGYSSAVNYESLTGLVEQHGRRWDPVEQSPYVAYRRENCTDTYGCVTSWRQLYYDDEASLKARLAMVNEYGLRGAGIWALGYDGGHAGPYRAFAESFLVDKSAPQAGIRLLAATQGDEGFEVSWAAKDTSSVVSYDVQASVDGGAWSAWLSGTTTTSDVWLGEDGHGYAFRVRARDSKGNVGTWNVTSTWDGTPALATGGFGRVTTDGLGYRAGPGTSDARLGTLDAGTIVAVTGGPVSADGYTWYEVTQPIREWNPVTFVERGVWVAARSSTATHVVAYRAPNSTSVDAGLQGLDFGSGASLLGTEAHAIAARTFSPNADGSRDAIRVRWTNTRAMDTLALRVYRAGGTLVGSVDVPALAAGPRSWEWNGRVDGSRVADGRYVLQLVGTADGRTYSAPSARPVTATQVAQFAITVDTVAPVVTSAAATTTLISPNGDGTLDTTRLTLASTGATRWTARISDGGGTGVRSAGGPGGSAGLTWDGRDDGGARIPDGRYTATLAAWDDAGNAASRAYAIRVDTTAPAVSLTASPSIFSPNGDGTADTSTLGWSADEAGSGTARVYRGTTLVQSWRLGSAASWAAAWDGRRSDGTAAPDGRYTFRVSLKDAAGNARSASSTVVIDRTASSLRWSGNFFPQDGDAIRRDAVLSWRLTRDATTTLRVYDAGGTLVRTAWSGRTQRAGARSWTWDGRGGNGAFVPQGRYMARLTVTSPLGTQELTRSVVAGGYAVTPSATRVGPGQTLVVRFSTVEPLSTRPVVTFRQPGVSAVRVTATRLDDGRYRAAFRVAAGPAGAGSVRIAAADSAGGTNATVVPITITR